MAAASPSWEATGLGPFLPLLPLRVGSALVLRRAADGLKAARSPVRAVSRRDERFDWSSMVRVPFGGDWKATSAAELADLRATEPAPMALIVLPEVLAGLAWHDRKAALAAFWRAMRAGDVLVLAHSNGRRPWDGLATFLLLRRVTHAARAYVCFGREENRTLRLVSTRYALQRRFIADAVHGMGRVSRVLHRLLAWAGLYPWVEDEHLLVAHKC